MIKKTFMLAGMIAVGVALTSTSALADTQGTQTFTANIKDSTCTITGLNQNVDLGPIAKGDPTLAAGNEYHRFPVHIGGCGSTFTSVEMTPTFDQIAGLETYGYAKNKGTAVVDAYWGVIGKGLVNMNTANPNLLQSGDKVTAPLTAGAADIFLSFGMNAGSHISSNVKPGTLDYPLLLTFDFK